MKKKIWIVLTKFLLGSYSSDIMSDIISMFFAHDLIMFIAKCMVFFCGLFFTHF